MNYKTTRDGAQTEAPTLAERPKSAKPFVLWQWTIMIQTSMKLSLSEYLEHLVQIFDLE